MFVPHAERRTVRVLVQMNNLMHLFEGGLRDAEREFSVRRETICWCVGCHWFASGKIKYFTEPVQQLQREAESAVRLGDVWDGIQHQHQHAHGNAWHGVVCCRYAATLDARW